MDRRYVNLLLILILVAAIIWVDLPRAEGQKGLKIGEFERTLNPVLGLDLRGGMQVLLAPQEGIAATRTDLDDTAQILESRANGLGVSEVIFQVAGDKYILGEFPGLTNTEEVIAAVKQTGLLEFIDTGSVSLDPGTPVVTDYGGAAVVSGETTNEDGETIWHTVMTGVDIKSVTVSADQSGVGGFVVNFELTPNGTKVFAEHTAANVGNFLTIVLDKTVISSPRIDGSIPDGQGVISGNFTSESANNLAVMLRYGRLAVPVEVVESRIIGPTLGSDSLSKSLLAGLIGFIIVALFMLLYYRLPGAVAILAVAIYAGLTFALFKLIPVTLTLPSIAGFLLSTGSALDANILIFERMKEELRNGRTILQALDLGWKRAWPSIRDSNIATIITSIILFWFGSTFGATIVKGFALTLALGVLVSLFTAVFVTRSLLTVILNFVKPERTQMLFGL
jgi:preprotein translocase subunit SecD